LETTGNWRVIQPTVAAHDPVNLYSNMNLWATGSLKPVPTPAPAKAAATTPAATTPAATTPAPSDPAAPAGPAAQAGGQVSLQQQGTIIVQHQGYLQAGYPMPYPQPQ